MSKNYKYKLFPLLNPCWDHRYPGTLPASESRIQPQSGHGREGKLFCVGKSHWLCGLKKKLFLGGLCLIFMACLRFCLYYAWIVLLHLFLLMFAIILCLLALDYKYLSYFQLDVIIRENIIIKVFKISFPSANTDKLIMNI